MIKGFFNPSELSVLNTTSTIPRCGMCKLYQGCHSPKMKPTGDGKRKVLIVAEAPGAKEDLKGIQLIGEAGQVLRNLLRSIGVRLDKDCWKTNVVICRPPSNNTPTNEQIIACRPNLIKTIKKLKPHTIILLGMSAVKSLIPYIWKDSIGNRLGKWVGWNIPSQKLNAWVCPTYHPSYLLRTKDDLLRTIMRGHLKQAFKHENKPWKNIPDYKEEVEIITRPSQAAKAIRDMIRLATPVAFDYETTCIKPEEIGAEIVSCSICQNGKRTIAYPWEAEAIDASTELFKSKIACRGANIKFEDRWTRRKLGFGVKNWVWDTMIASHVLDNRSGITSVKFQSFVKLGVEGYDAHIKPYLKAKKNKRINRIKELPINDVLLYNGIDSIVEWNLSEIQIKEMQKLNKNQRLRDEKYKKK